MERESAAQKCRAKLDRFQDKEFFIHASGIRFFSGQFSKKKNPKNQTELGPQKFQKFDLDRTRTIEILAKFSKKFHNYVDPRQLFNIGIRKFSYI